MDSDQGPIEQLRSLRHAIFLSLKNRGGFRAIQHRLRVAYVRGVINNELQQAILTACEAVRAGPVGSFTEEEIKKFLEEIFSIEIELWKQGINRYSS